MVIAMSRPTLRPGSSHLQVRKRIPMDIQRIIEALPDWPHPKGWGKTEITLSTGTHARQGETGKDTFARLNAEIAATFTMLRTSPRPQELTDAQIGALAGEAYAMAIETAQPAKWPSQSAFSLADCIHRLTAAKGIWITPESRSKLLTAMIGESGSLITATEHYEARSRGNYSRQPTPFPQWQGTAPAPAPERHQPVKLASLIERFLTEPRDDSAALSYHTIKKYKQVLNEFSAFLSNPDATTVTSDDIRRFQRHRLDAKGITARTWNKGDLPAIKSLFNWATDADAHLTPNIRPLQHNPATANQIKTDRKLGVSANAEAQFYDSEIAAILSAALAISPDAANPAWPAAGFVDTKFRCFMKPEVADAEKTVWQ